MSLLMPNKLENETPADAVEVDDNFVVTQQYINANVIVRNGTVSMQAPLQLFGDPINDDDAVRKAYVDSLLPIGVVLPYAGITVPAGAWAFCNGASVQTAIYPKLFQVTQYRFGGSGGNFNLPDLRGRFPIGMTSGAGADTRFNEVGDKGGAWDAKLPYHRHGIDHNHPAKATSSDTHTHTVSDVGDHSHGIPGSTTLVRTGGAAIGATGDKAFGSTGPHVFDGGHKHTLTSDTHHHTLDLSLIDAWSSYAGTEGIDQVPPYLTVSFVIRVG